MNQIEKSHLSRQHPSKRLLKIVSYDTNSIEGGYDETTTRLFGALQNAKNYFAESLFDRELPPVVLTLNDHTRSLGYYMSHKWLDRASSDIKPGININPSFLNAPPRQVMSTLAHELCHHYHQVYGQPGRNGYHNREFANIMFSVGLMCSATGEPGGETIGRRMSHYIISNGRFDRAFNTMPEEFLLPFTTINTQSQVQNPSNNKNKTMYQCGLCNTKVWGKSSLDIRCNACYTDFKEVII